MGINVITATATRPVQPDPFSAVGNPIYFGLETDRMITTGAVVGVSTITITALPANASYVTIADYTFYFLNAPDAFNPFNVQIAVSTNLTATNLAAAINSNANTLASFTATSAANVVTITGATSDVTLGITTSTSPASNCTAAVVTANTAVVYLDNYRLNVDLFIDEFYLRGNLTADMKRLRRISLPTGKVLKETAPWDYYKLLFELQEPIKPWLEFDIPKIGLLFCQTANRCIRRFRIEYTETYGTLSSSNKIFTHAPYVFHVLNATCEQFPSLMTHQMNGDCPATPYKWDWPVTLYKYFGRVGFRHFLTNNIIRRTYPGALEYLCWWIPNAPIDIYTVHVTRYFFDGTSDEIDMDTSIFTNFVCCDDNNQAPNYPQETIFVIPIHKVWFQYPYSMDGVERFEVKIKNPTLETVYSNTVTYYIDWDCKEFHTVVFKNKFGVPDTFHLSSKLDAMLQVEKLTASVSIDRKPIYQASLKNTIAYSASDTYEWKGAQVLDDITQPLFVEMATSNETWLIKPYTTQGECCLFDCRGEYVDGVKETSLSTDIRKYYNLFGQCGDFVVICKGYGEAKTFEIVDGIFTYASVSTAVMSSIFFTVLPTFLNNALGVRVSFGFVTIDEWRYRVFCPGEYDECGEVFTGTVPGNGSVQNWQARRIYVGQAAGTVNIPYSIPAGCTMKVFYGAALVAGVNGPAAATQVYVKNNVHDWIVVVMESTTAADVSYSFSVNCTEGAFVPKSPACKTNELTPILFTDTEYNFVSREDNRIETEFKFIEARENLTNTR